MMPAEGARGRRLISREVAGGMDSAARQRGAEAVGGRS